MSCLARRVLLLSALLIGAARPARSSCGTVTNIPNIRVTSYTSTSATLAWDAPSGVPAGTQYEVFNEWASGYCSFKRTYTNLGSVSSRQATITGLTPNWAYLFWVRVKGDACSWSSLLGFDTFTTAPVKPVISQATGGASSVFVQFSYSDPRTLSVGVERATGSGSFGWLGMLDACGANPKSFTDSNLAAGTYRYRLNVANMATAGMTNAVRSDEVKVTVGSAPSIVSFTATPSTIRAGQSAVLAFITAGASSVVIDNGVGAQQPSGSVTVSPAATTTYTLTAMNGGLSATASAVVNVMTAPAVTVSAMPPALLQLSGSGGAVSTFAIANTGGASTTVTLSQSGNFFTVTPTSFILAAGATQIVTVRGLAQNAGAFDGTVSASGNGVPSGLQVPVRLLSAAAPAGIPSAQAVSNRVDVAAPAGGAVSGAVAFVNKGSGTVTGIATSDAPWIVPESGVITAGAGQTASLRFTIDRTKRSDSAAAIGSATGNLSLSYFTSSSPALVKGSSGTATPVVSIVTVVDTVQPTVTAGAPPPLGTGEVALFVPGVGHITGSVGLFVSDVSLLNIIGSRPITDLRFYYTPLAGSGQKTAALGTLGASAVSVADIVKSIFGADSQLGSLQLRSADASKLIVSTKVFNASNPAGTYGTVIPTFRSDRSAGSGESVYLAGVTRDATSHTNIFIQETSGYPVTVQTEFLGPTGATISARSDSVGAFALSQLNNVVPPGAVSAVLTNTGAQPGRFSAYATPVDDASGDNWSVVDWSRQNGYSGTVPVIVPIAGVVRGANNTFFRTDVAIMNSSSGQASATVRYVGRSGELADRQVTLSPRQTTVINDVMGTLFGIRTDTAGYLLLTPVTGTFEVTSRTYTTVAGQPATYGTGVPTIAASEAIRNGAVRTIGALEDTCRSTITAGRAATFRTNFALLEVGGSTIKVRVTLRYTFAAGSLVTAVGTAAKEYVLSPGQFAMLNGLAGEVIGVDRESAGDLRGIDATFQVVAGDGALIVFTSSVDNGTGDSILRVE